MANKKAKNGQGNIRRRADGRWEGRFLTGNINPRTGRPVSKSVYGKTAEEVRKKITDLTHKVDKGEYTEPNKITVDEWFNMWLEEYVKPSTKPSTYIAYKSNYENHIKPSLGAAKMQDVLPINLKHIYTDMLKHGNTTKTKDGCSTKTIKNVAAILSAGFEAAVDNKIIPHTPYRKKDVPKKESKEIEPLSSENIHDFLEAINDDPYRNVFGVYFFCGVRRAECLALTWDDIDFDNMSITVSKQLQDDYNHETSNHYVIAHYTKTDKNGRKIYPLPEAFEYLKAEKIRQMENKVAAGSAWQVPEGFPDNLVFTDPLGSFIVPRTVYNHYKRIVKNIGIPDARLHDLRHSIATFEIDAGVSPKAVQAMLGHKTASFTMNHYVHSTESMQRNAANEAQAYFEANIKRA